MRNRYIVLTEQALDRALMSGGFCEETIAPQICDGVVKMALGAEILGYRTPSDNPSSYSALVDICLIERLLDGGVRINDIFRRVARVVASMKSPPIHLPRQWLEYHHKNLLAFFAAPREFCSERWIVEIMSGVRCSRFCALSSESAEVDLKSFSPESPPAGFDSFLLNFLNQIIEIEESVTPSLATEIDLTVIGSGSVVQGRSYEDWELHLTSEQRRLLDEPISKSVRMIGPAGSGKTLSLCMRALKVSRSDSVSSGEQKVLIVTHSWAMAERIDGVLLSLNNGAQPERITVFPLLSLLEFHVGNIGQRKIDIIGDDSTEGRRKSIELINNIVMTLQKKNHNDVSKWIVSGLENSVNNRYRLDLISNLYEEISGIISASGVTFDDEQSIQKYLYAKREDWMPPFDTVDDRMLALDVYDKFNKQLIDREAITTDQFILDSIRVLETFNWRMRKETEGYDYIFVDELQLFDPQERSAIELLARSKKGVPFITAEDPTQGVFSSLNGRHSVPSNETLYLETVHRFNEGIFNFISYIYALFPLNSTPLRINNSQPQSKEKPILYNCIRDENFIDCILKIITSFISQQSSGSRICIATLGNMDEKITSSLETKGINVTRLKSFDDVENSHIISAQLLYHRGNISAALSFRMLLLSPSE